MQNEKNAGKIVRLLVIAVMTAVIAGALGVTASAARDDPITREQLAVFLYHYAKSRNFVVPAYATFKQPDASQIDSWALDAMKWAYSKEIIEEANGKLTPLDNAARHMIATALMQFCESYSM